VIIDNRLAGFARQLLIVLSEAVLVLVIVIEGLGISATPKIDYEYDYEHEHEKASLQAKPAWRLIRAVERRSPCP
jgi:hypothetical protein